MMFTVAAWFALQGALAPPQAAARLPARDRESLTADSLEAAELRFFYQWGDAYSLSSEFDKKFDQRWPLPQAMIECTICCVSVMARDRLPLG
jgi:hypothetical protein